MVKKLSISLFGFVFLLMAALAFALPAGAQDRNCGDFDSGAEVWDFWESNGYHSQNDPHGLDGDSDGIPCESLTLPDFEAEFTDHEEVMTSTTEEDTTEDATEEEEAVEEEDAAEEATEEDGTEEEASEEDAEAPAPVKEDNGSEEEGGALPATATANPFMVLMGTLAAAGAAVLLTIRRRATV
ncbi:excalibur calcium-binding domain-containing protein [Bacillus sp. FJAT-44742]|uniref:excalibur calcium-binding domain-containing protein n=1 Tax=Bacillus sp. FJAT-44742 TaxID=2014005 RepID=UPI000C244EE7|nr:excalibur calcium-binding domain-containing protein [Bacillus sp. FJAT-44742]